MSNFGERVRRLRKERGLTLEAVAKKVGSRKGYISGIENGKVNPPSIKIIRRFCKLFEQDERTMIRIAWLDKAPDVLRDEAELFLSVVGAASNGGVDLSPIPLINTVETGYTADLTSDGRLKPAVEATLVLPGMADNVECAATVCDGAMVYDGPTSYARGDVLLLTREEKLKNGSFAYVVFTSGGRRRAMFRQIMMDKNDHLVLQPQNQEHPLEFLSQDDIDAVYRVVGSIGNREGVMMKASV